MADRDIRDAAQAGAQHMFGYMASTGHINCICGWTQEVPEGTTREQAHELWRAHAETPAAGPTAEETR